MLTTDNSPKNLFHTSSLGKARNWHGCTYTLADSCHQPSGLGLLRVCSFMPIVLLTTMSFAKDWLHDIMLGSR